MRKNILIIFALIMLSACRGRQTQAESTGATVADSTEVMAPKETESMASRTQPTLRTIPDNTFLFRNHVRALRI